MLRWFRKDKDDARPAAPTDPFRRADHVVSTGEGDRTVLLDPVGGEYYGLDEVGTRIWELLPACRTAAAIAERLEGEYDAPREVLEADAAILLGRLAALKLVVPA